MTGIGYLIAVPKPWTDVVLAYPSGDDKLDEYLAETNVGCPKTGSGKAWHSPCRRRLRILERVRRATFLCVILLASASCMGTAAEATEASALPLIQTSLSGQRPLGNLGGNVVLTGTVTNAEACTIRSGSWEGPAFSANLKCSGSHHDIRYRLLVPPNLRSTEFIATIRVTATNAKGSATRFESIGVAPAPASPTGAPVSFFGAGATVYLNWSGYALQGGILSGLPSDTRFTAVSAEWKVPEVDCAVTPTSDSADWVGVDGSDMNNYLFQTGVGQECIHGDVSDDAWWTDQSLGYTPKDLFPVRQGDVIRAEVLRVRPGEWEYYVADLTSGKSSQHPESYSGPGAAADWVVESPGSGPRVLADFGSVTFTHLGLSASTGRWTEPTLADSLETLGSDGSVIASTSAVTGDGAAATFTVAYRGCGTATCTLSSP